MVRLAGYGFFFLGGKMAKIYRTTDRIKVKIGEIVVTIAPLSLHDKTEATKLIASGTSRKDYGVTHEGLIYLLKCALKDVSGFETSDNQPYKLQFEDGKVTDDCISDLFNHEVHEKLVMLCTSLVRGISNKLVDHEGKEIEGVEFLKSEKEDNSTPNA